MERETAMKILKELHNKSLFAERTALETIIPELKESEDERVKKRILLSLEKDLMATKNSGCSTKDLEDCITWLEKQGKKQPIIVWHSINEEPEEMKELFCEWESDDATWHDVAFYDEESHTFRHAKMPINVTKWIYVDELLEKQGEQKSVLDFKASNWYVSKVDGKIHDMTYNPADKVEPKFHKGEWIVWKNKCYKVNYNGCGYELIDQNGLSTWLEYGTVDTSARLYDVAKDAKDGDVVVDKSDGTIGIFESIGHHPDGGSFNDPSYCFLHCRYDDGYFFADFEDGNMMTSDDVIPATQEQRDLLFQKMKEAGYEWSDKDRKLIKIVK